MALKFAVTGSTGMIGSVVCDWLKAHGHKVTQIIRPTTKKHVSAESLVWDVQKKTIDLARLEGHDVVIHFAGANIADRPWTVSYKKEILASRIEWTSFLAESLCKLKHPPKTFLCGSAIGFYGDHLANEMIDEGGRNGHGFLAEVTREWEAAAKPAENSGIRVINMRTGVVLDKKGGALAKMLPPFYLGLGGPIGSGNQIMSWIALDEIPRIISFLVENVNISGPVNFTAPHPVSSRDFAKVLGHVLHRPAFLPLPAFAVSTIFGEMGKELLLGGAHVTPRRLLESGYTFTYPDLQSALSSILN